MPTAFVPADADLLHACAEQAVITGNQRLRREVIRAYNAHQQRQGHKAWPTPNVHSLDGFLAEAHRQLRAAHPRSPRLVDWVGERALFQAAAPQGAERLTDLAVRAWRLAHDWQIPLEATALAATENGRVFTAWARRVRDTLERHGAVTHAQLPALLRDADLPVPRALLCLGFEATPTSAIEYLDALGARGVDVRRSPAPQAPRAAVARYEFANQSQELGAMAQWARQTLEQADDPEDLRIGVVVPDLGSRYLEVQNRFSAEMDPLGTRPVAGQFDLAGGLPLGAQPIWQTARDLLQLCLTQLPTDRLLPLLHSPYLALNAPAALNPDMGASVRIWELLEHHKDPILAELNRLCPPRDLQSPLDEWCALGLRLLDRAGLRGTGADSGQYQAWEQIHGCLSALRAAALPHRVYTAHAALSALAEALAGHAFAPQTPAAPIQIMGYLETTGLQFSHLWVSGMEDTRWPSPPAPNPFIPIATQRAAGVPRVDADGELTFANQRMAHWLASSESVIFSHARDIDNDTHGPSPLVSAIRAEATTPLPAWTAARSHPLLEHRAGNLEDIADTQGRKLPAGPHAGGTGLVREQALCPFRGWAVHRLGLRAPRLPHGFPDPLDRGILIHEALRLMLSTPSLRHPREVDRAGVAAAADAALRAHYGRFPTSFVRHERARLIRLLTAWLDLEHQREEFSVIALEAEDTAEIAGLTLRVRLDRLDRTRDGLAVIDYKTGRVSAASLLGDRLTQPQLPLYVISRDGVRAALFGQLDEQRPRLIGVAQDPPSAPGIRTEALPPGGWSALERRWRDQLHTLAREFRDGYAAVEPSGPDACQTCHLQAFCRIAEDAPLL